MKFLILTFKVFKRLYKIVCLPYEQTITFILMKLNGVVIDTGFKSRGIPCVDISLGGSFIIGKNFRMNNGKRYNKIGRPQQCFFIVGKKGKLNIGNNVGISQTALICEKSISIGDYVKIGGNVVIYDTNFHTLDSYLRTESISDICNTIRQNVIIGNNVFIGAHSTILKGVTIGNNSIIGACSVVTKDVPMNEIWGGNPAKFIRSL